MSKAYKTDRPIDGIHCEVASCDFHAPEDKCTADCIKVGVKSTGGSQCADCETYSKKDSCCQ